MTTNRATLDIVIVIISGMTASVKRRHRSPEWMILSACVTCVRYLSIYDLNKHTY